MKAQLSDVTSAFNAFTRILDETKLGADAAWSVSRMVRKLKGHVKDYQRAQTKLYKDAGGFVEGNGIGLPLLQPRDKDESLADWDKRQKAYADNANRVHEEVEKLQDREVEVELDPIKFSIFPRKQKNDKGEEVEVRYRGTDLANCGPFLVHDDEKKE